MHEIEHTVDGWDCFICLWCGLVATRHGFRVWCTYQLTINGCKQGIVQVIRGDIANTMANFYTREILSYDDVRREYLKAVPVFGL